MIVKYEKIGQMAGNYYKIFYFREKLQKFKNDRSSWRKKCVKKKVWLEIIENVIVSDQ